VQRSQRFPSTSASGPCGSPCLAPHPPLARTHVPCTRHPDLQRLAQGCLGDRCGGRHRRLRLRGGRGSRDLLAAMSPRRLPGSCHSTFEGQGLPVTCSTMFWLGRGGGWHGAGRRRRLWRCAAGLQPGTVRPCRSSRPGCRAPLSAALHTNYGIAPVLQVMSAHPGLQGVVLDRKDQVERGQQVGSCRAAGQPQSTPAQCPVPSRLWRVQLF